MGVLGRPFDWRMAWSRLRRTAVGRPVLLSAALVAVLATAIAVSAVGYGWWSDGSDGGAPAGAPTGPATGATSTVPPEGLGRSVPVRLTIPAVDVDASVEPLGLEEDGALAPLSDPAAVGWPAEATSPGEPGSAALLGSVDTGGSSEDGSTEGEGSGDSGDADSGDAQDAEDSEHAEDSDGSGSGERGAFARVHQLDTGDRIDVLREDSEVASFEVVEVRPHAAGEPPEPPVGPPRLRLVGIPGGVPAEDDRQENDSEESDSPGDSSEEGSTEDGEGDAVVVTAVLVADSG